MFGICEHTTCEHKVHCHKKTAGDDLSSFLSWTIFTISAMGDNTTLKFGDTTTSNLKPGSSDKYTVSLKVVNNSSTDAIMRVVPSWDKNNIAEPKSYFWSGVNGGKRVCKAADGGNYIEDMSKCPGNANYLYKFDLPAGAEKIFYIPDGGAASNNISFHMGCTKNPDQESWNRDFDTCVYGSFFGKTPTPISNDLMASNTLFQATWGCKGLAV